MQRKPQFNPCYSVETIETDNVFLLSEREKVWLSDRLSCSLAALIDGNRNTDEIIDIIQQSLLQDIVLVRHKKLSGNINILLAPLLALCEN